MAPSRPRRELLVDTRLCPETVLPVNLTNELPYSQLQDRTSGSAQQARVVSKGVHCRGNTVTWVCGTVKHVLHWIFLIIHPLLQALIMAPEITVDILLGVRDWLMPSQIDTNPP